MKVERITRRTFRIAGNLAPANQAFPFLVLAGVANKVIRIKKVTISGITLTAVAYVRMQLARFTALPSGGTTTPVNGNPVDTQGGAAGSGVAVSPYTAQPSAGTAQLIAEKKILAQATVAAAAGIPGEVEWRFGDGSDNEDVTVRVATEGFGVQFPAAPGAGIALSWEIEWTEDGN